MDQVDLTEERQQSFQHGSTRTAHVTTVNVFKIIQLITKYKITTAHKKNA